jgi:hypothetical protein
LKLSKRASMRSQERYLLGRCFPLVLLGLLFCAPGLSAQEQTQLWPEVDTYVRLSPRTGFMFTTEFNSDPHAGTLQGELGPNFDVYLRPFLRPRLRDLDPSKSKLLTFRAGYRYLPSIAGNKPAENRPLVELTARFHVPLAILLSDRSREEFRFIADKPFATRYRNRLSLERNFSIRNYRFTPYARDEVFYANRQISANTTTIGSIFPVNRRAELEFYWKTQRSTTSTPSAFTYGAGAILSLYL